MSIMMQTENILDRKRCLARTAILGAYWGRIAIRPYERTYERSDDPTLGAY